MTSAVFVSPPRAAALRHCLHRSRDLLFPPELLPLLNLGCAAMGPSCRDSGLLPGSSLLQAFSNHPSHPCHSPFDAFHHFLRRRLISVSSCQPVIYNRRLFQSPRPPFLSTQSDFAKLFSTSTSVDASTSHRFCRLFISQTLIFTFYSRYSHLLPLNLTFRLPLAAFCPGL